MRLKQYRQRTYTNDEGNTVSDRYTLYSPGSYRTIILEEDLTLDEIAYAQYGTPLYYWMVGEVNNVRDPFLKIKKGTSIKVPVM